MAPPDSPCVLLWSAGQPPKDTPWCLEPPRRLQTPHAPHPSTSALTNSHRVELPAEGAPLRLCNLSLTGSTFACGFPLSNCDEGVNTFTVTSYTLSMARATQLTSWASSYGAEVVATTSGVSGSSALPLATSSATGCAADAGYSDGEMAGVGVGVGVPLLLAALAALWLWRREVGRSRKMGDVSAGQYGGAQQMAPRQLQQQQYPHGHFQQQVPYHEVGTDGERAELPPK